MGGHHPGLEVGGLTRSLRWAGSSSSTSVMHGGPDQTAHCLLSQPGSCRGKKLSDRQAASHWLQKLPPGWPPWLTPAHPLPDPNLPTQGSLGTLSILTHPGPACHVGGGVLGSVAL